MDLKEVCRTCLQPSERMVSIFSSVEVPNSDFSKLPIIDLLQIFTEISVSPNEDFPDNICKGCLGEIHQTYTFKLKCEKSEAILKQLKEDRKHMNELQNSPSEHAHYTANETEPRIGLIKTERADCYEILNDDEEEEDISLVQEVKQEPEIDINIDEKEDFYDDNSDVECFENDLQCLVCMKIFKNKSNLEAHISGPYKCETYAQNFQNEVELTLSPNQKANDDETTNSRPFQCPTCSKFFRRKADLNRHMIIHTKERPFQCKVCLRRYQYKHYLKSHMQMTHSDGITNKKFKCAICSKFFGTKSYLNVHMRIHTEERPFQCDVCLKKFRFKHNLTNHMEIAHIDKTKSKKLKCAICAKLFICKSYLNAHMRIHSTEKPVQCQVCLEKFRYKYNLLDHMQSVHSDGTIKKFKCEICSKLFGRKFHLNQHVKIHTEEKPFQCEICSSDFRHKRYLKAHIQRMHDIKPEEVEQTQQVE